MHSASYDDYADVVRRLVVRALAQFDVTAEAAPYGVRLKQWSAVRIAVERAEVSRNVWGEEEWEGGTWSAWFDLTWQYHAERPLSAVRSHAIGQGLDRLGAVEDAVVNWGKGIAPALLSCTRGVAVGEADILPVNHSRAIPGWSAINGPYVPCGVASKTAELAAHLETHPLVEPVRDLLAVALAKDVPFHTISLHRGVAPSGAFADVAIDNHVDEDASELLKRVHWPKPITDTPFLSVRQFLLCVAPDEGKRIRESEK